LSSDFSALERSRSSVNSGSLTFPALAASSISEESLFWSARIASIRVLSSRRCSSTPRSSSTCSAAPRLARAERTPSGSARICFRSSVAAPRYGAASELVVVWAGAGASVTSCPAYFETKAATFCASAPTTMFWGMIAPEKPPLRIA
jgi:hypothetical protein